ncbi:8-amino-7-oxononanoate synthase [Nymphon striatum]|nr:8-amino-7-oxononanoate synthase [Nymphon striatum]
MSDFNEELDARGLNCPLPILRAKKGINGLEAGQTLKIIATDPGSVKDFEAFCKQTGNELVSTAEDGGEQTGLSTPNMKNDPKLIKAFLKEKQQQHLYRSVRISESPQQPQMDINGKELLTFCSNDYLGLANHPNIIEAFKKAADTFGVGSGAAHLINGHSIEHQRLEEELADFTGRDRTLLFSTGYMANIGTVNALLERGDTLYADRLNHASLIDAGLLSQSKMRRYAHNDTEALKKLYENNGSLDPQKNSMILSDGVFSMDGDEAPAKELSKLAQQQQAWLMIDDAHGFGTLGKNGAGLLEQEKLDQSHVPILMATLGKAIGVSGAFIAGNNDLIEYLIQTARTYIYTTAMPPAIASAIRASLKLVQKEEWRREKLNQHIQQFKKGAEELGIKLMPSNTAIQPILIGSTEEASNLSQKLEEKGYSCNRNSSSNEDQLRKEIKTLKKTLKSAQSETEKAEIKATLEKAEEKLLDTTINLENIAADTDLSLLRISKEEPFNLQKELFSLLEPALKEMKHATSDVRLKSQLREKVEYYEEREPIAKQALKNIAALNRKNKNKNVKKALIKMNKNWSKQLVFIQSELQAKRLQLNKLESQEVSLASKSESYFKDFFQRRGWTLIQALLAIITVLIISRFAHKIIARTVKGYRAEHRGVQLRLIDLTHRFLTFLFVVIAPMIIFYLEEDWVLFSLGILLLIGIAWSLRLAVPRYWKQLELFLNAGPVREGERLLLNGIPWQVKHINIYTTLENPVAGLSQRVDIDELVDLRSRPVEMGEPWFPCKKGDWIVLKDGVRGKVIGISIEMIQLIQRGGAICTYTMNDFLALSPKNFSKSFRIKETIGIAYKHQKESTNSILETLENYINKSAIDEGYKDSIQNIRVEFQAANDSSLDIVVIADFKGDVADLYNRLRRAIQRWCVDACTQYNWEIPYPQLTLHSENK